VPFCHLTFSAVRPVLRRFERVKVPDGTLGAALRERRWGRALEQNEAAGEIGTTLATYRNWEVNRSVPTLKYVPGVIAFLGYDWRPEPRTFGDELRRTRTALGVSIRQLARELRLDTDTIEDSECERSMPSQRVRSIVETWLRTRCYSPSCGERRTLGP
jgi:DNA-binding transcriptional regulator YiaG